MEWFSKWFSINPQIAFPTTGLLSIGVIFMLIKILVWGMKFAYVPRKEAYDKFITQKESDLKDEFLEKRFDSIDGKLGIIESDIKVILKNGK